MPAPIVSIFDQTGYELCVEQAVRLLNDGGLVVLPTETVYGVAGRLDRPEVLSRLQALREHPRDRPFIPHLGARDEAVRFLDPPGDLERRMMKKLWPGPVALMFDVSQSRQAEVARDLNIDPATVYAGRTITLRCPDHVAAIDILRGAEAPVAMLATERGYDNLNSPAARLADELSGKVDLVVDAGPTHYGKSSTVIHITGDTYRIVRDGVYDERIIEKLLKTTLLFVCSGNTCRSAMAEALARKILADRLNLPVQDLGSRGIDVISAGSFAMGGAPAAAHAVDVLREQGADLSRHRSKHLTVELIHQADRIYTMSRDHSQAVAALVPSAMEKVVPLNPDGDIADPVGSDIATYRNVASQLKALIERRLDEMPVI